MSCHTSAKHRVIAALIAFSLAWTPLAVAKAEESDLEALQNAAIVAGDTYEQAQERVDALEQEIENNQARVDALEAELPAMRENASKAIRIQYKLSQDQPNLIGMLLSSDDLSQFLEQLYYLDSVASANTEAINNLAEAQNQLKVTQAQLSADLEEADSQRDVAQQALADAQAKADAAKQKALEDAAANQAAYEAEQAAGEADPTIAEAKPSAEAATDEASTGSSNDSEATTPATIESSKTEATSTPETSDTSSDSDAANSASGNTGNEAAVNQDSAQAGSTQTGTVSYTYVQASMYGEGDGFMYGTTASGDVVTPTSMGVAMKTMPLGTVIEITYNGNTVTAVVNDRGPYVGNRQIDLQPAVAHALGFDGVGTVGYRVVG